MTPPPPHSASYVLHIHSINTSPSLLQVLSNSGEYRQTEYEYFHYVLLLFFNIGSWNFDKIAQTDIIWFSEPLMFNGITLSKTW